MQNCLDYIDPRQCRKRCTRRPSSVSSLRFCRLSTAILGNRNHYCVKIRGAMRLSFTRRARPRLKMASVILKYTMPRKATCITTGSVRTLVSAPNRCWRTSLRGQRLLLLIGLSSISCCTEMQITCVALPATLAWRSVPSIRLARRASRLPLGRTVIKRARKEETDPSARLKIADAKAQAHAKVRHPFRVINLQCGYTKVRLRGLTKNLVQKSTIVCFVIPLDESKAIAGDARDEFFMRKIAIKREWF